MSASAEMQSLLLDLWADLQSVKILWQARRTGGVRGHGAGSLARRYRQRVLGRMPIDATQALGIGSMQRLLFPLSTLAAGAVRQRPAALLAKHVICSMWRSRCCLSLALIPDSHLRVAPYLCPQRPGCAPRSAGSAGLAWIGVAVHIDRPVAACAKLARQSLHRRQAALSLLLVLQGVLSVVVTLLARNVAGTPRRERA